MTENDEKAQQCMECGSTSEGKVLIQCVKEGEPDWVCVHCLPILIHGAH